MLGFYGAEVASSAYDLFQCKHYGRPLSPSDVWVEVAKVCVYTHRGSYRLPRKYFFVSAQGIGPKLQQLLQEPEEFKRQLIANWESKCATEVSERETIVLEGGLLAHVQAMDFSVFDSVEPTTLIEDLRVTPYFTPRFGLLQKHRPEAPVPPSEPGVNEVRYVTQLLQAYEDYRRRPVPDVDALSNDSALRGHLARQREAFYRAESLREFERDTLGGDDSGFVALMEEIYRGVVDVCEGDHESGFHRVNAVTGEARRLMPTDYVLLSEMHLEDRAGICHHLANDDRLRWVP